VQCNGPNSEQNDVDMYFGKGLLSKKLYTSIYEHCKFPSTAGAACSSVLSQASREVGPHNVYFIYDNCPNHEQILKATGHDMQWLKHQLRARLSPEAANEGGLLAADKSGGFDWSCGGMDATAKWITRADVRTALHLPATSGSAFHYRSSGPASVTLWPFLATKIRVLIYNGDADACVPYKGNEEWIDALEAAGTIKETEAWRPWFTKKGGSRAPAGYATSYSVPAAPSLDFSFVTIRLAGHMVPTFQPEASLAFYQRFIDGEVW